MKQALYLILLLISMASARAQQRDTLLRQQLLSRTFEAYSCPDPPKRKALSLKGKSLAAKLNPVYYLAGGLMFFYQQVVSAQLQADCAYEISCSEFTKRSIEYHGLLKGTLRGLHQLNTCFPTAAYEHCRYTLSESHKIKNSVEGENEE